MGELAKWYEKSGPEEDVVVSTHVSLSRNLRGIPFPDKLDNDRRVEVLKKIDEAVTGNPCFPRRNSCGSMCSATPSCVWGWQSAVW